MAQEGRGGDDLEPAKRAGAPRHLGSDLDQPVDVALRVDPPRKGEPHELVGRGLEGSVAPAPSEHHAADLAGADPASEVELAGQRLTRIPRGGYVRQQTARIDEHGVAPGGEHDRDARALEAAG